MARIAELADWLRARDDIAVIMHVSPDGDCVGSGLAILRALEKLKKRACLVSKSPSPAMYGFLPGVERIVAPDETPFAPRCLLFEDVAAADRAGDGGYLSARVADTALLDHHMTNPGFAQLNLIVPGAAASGEIALNLIDALGVPLDAETALCLYAAISTDTGGFAFSNTTVSTLNAFSRCLAAGIDLAEANRRLFRLRSVERTRLLGWALDRLELFEDEKIALVRLEEEAFRRCGAGPADTEGIVNFLIDMEGVGFAILAEARGERLTRFSLRAGPGRDAAAIAGRFGGGGHLSAAGLTMNLPLGEAVQIVLDAARK